MLGVFKKKLVHLKLFPGKIEIINISTGITATRVLVETPGLYNKRDFHFECILKLIPPMLKELRLTETILRLPYRIIIENLEGTGVNFTQNEREELTLFFGEHGASMVFIPVGYTEPLDRGEVISVLTDK